MVSKENLEDIHRPEVESAEAMAQLDSLIDLLVELKIIDQKKPAFDTKSSFVESGVSSQAQNLCQIPQMLALPPAKETLIIQPSTENSVAIEGEQNIIEEDRRNKSEGDSIPHQEEPPNRSFGQKAEDLHSTFTDKTPEINEDQAIELLSQLIFSAGEGYGGAAQGGQKELFESNEISHSQTAGDPENHSKIAPEKENNTDDPFRRLQDILVGTEVSEVRDLVAYVDQKVANLEHQIYEPGELINLLLPWIAELLSRKVNESKEDVVRAIAPIIDQIIESRTDQDREAMSAALAPLISAAISQQISNNPEEVASAIAPTMGKAIKEQITLERDAMVDALYPVIGSTISKYMAEAIRSINEKIANVFSIEGITRKISARIHGVSEAELIFKEAIPFTVQAVFLIQKTSGLVIYSVQQSGDRELEADMIAGMLTAIRSFVNDCIAQSGEISELDAIDYGNCKIILEVAGYCYLAVVIKGDAPKQFIQKMRQTLGSIILNYGKAIESFDGDPSTVPAPVKSLVQALLETPSKQQTAKQPVALIGISLAALSIVLVPWGIYAYRNGINRQIEAKTIQALTSTPELAVYRLNVKADGNKLRLSGKLPSLYLRSQAEQIARNAAPGSKLYNEIIAVEVPPDPLLAAAEVKRVTSVLNGANGVDIRAQYNAGKVTLSGTVNSIFDAKKITLALAQIPGVKSVTNTFELQPLKIDTRIYFERGSSQLSKAEAGDKINGVKQFLNKHPAIALKIIAHSDKTGTVPENQRLSNDRAQTVRDALVGAGVEPKRLQIVATPEPPLDVPANQTPVLSRVVRFEPIREKMK